MKIKIFIIPFLACILSSAHAQIQSQDFYDRYNIKRNPWLVLLNKFTINATFGVGIIKEKYQFDNARYIFTPNGLAYLREINGIGSSPFVLGYNDNIGRFQIDSVGIVSPLIVDLDSSDLLYKNKSFSIPLNLSIHYEFKKFRVGGGVEYEKVISNNLQQESSMGLLTIQKVNELEFVKRYFRYYALVGYEFYEFWNFSFTADLRLGSMKSKLHSNDLYHKKTSSYLNPGLTIEYFRSEYFSVTSRIGTQFQTNEVPYSEKNEILKYKRNFLQLSLGIRVNIPDTKRSPRESDKTQVKHIYYDLQGNKTEVRGQPIWKAQSPKLGEDYKWNKNKSNWLRNPKRRKKKQQKTQNSIIEKINEIPAQKSKE